jgi:hypothetical protein
MSYYPIIRAIPTFPGFSRPVIWYPVPDVPYSSISGWLLVSRSSYRISSWHLHIGVAGFFILPSKPISREECGWLLALDCMLNIVLQSTEESVDEEFLREIRSAALH